MSESNVGSPLSGEVDLEALAHPQAGFKMMRDMAPVMDTGDMIVVGGLEEVREVLRNAEVFSSGFDAVDIGQVRPLIPLQIDPPDHKNYRKILDPLFAPRQVAQIEGQTRKLVREMIEPLVGQGHTNFHDTIAETLPTTVFLQLLGLPVERRKEFIALKDGIIRPEETDVAERLVSVSATGQKIYAVLEEVLAERVAEPADDFMSGFLSAEVDGERLTHEDIVDIGYLFFLAGLDTVTASLDCFLAYLAQHPEQRKAIVDDPAVIPHAIEEMLRWESPVQGVVRISTTDTELAGCPIKAHTPVAVVLGSANTDESGWADVETVDFDREENKHLAFGGGPHRCLGSHLARMELRVALEEWHAAVPDYALADGIELHYTQGLRAVDNLELVW